MAQVYYAYYYARQALDKDLFILLFKKSWRLLPISRRPDLYQYGRQEESRSLVEPCARVFRVGEKTCEAKIPSNAWNRFSSCLFFIGTAMGAEKSSVIKLATLAPMEVRG